MDANELPDLIDVPMTPAPPGRLVELASPAQAAQFIEALDRAAAVFAGRTVWNVNSTACGGGVAEMLQSLVPYAKGAGVDARWLVIQGDAEFFAITKRIHNHLHGAAGDGGALDEAARTHYEDVARINASRLLQRVRTGDVVILHDPQTAGLIPRLRDGGREPLVWRCHVGVDTPNELVKGAWSFLRPYVTRADAFIFSRRAFVWDGLDPSHVAIIGPSIDPFAAKNYDLTAESVSALLSAAGIQSGNGEGPGEFLREDGTTSRVRHRASLDEDAPLLPDAPLVLQVSRWDRLKDPIGVIEGFAEYTKAARPAHLMLAGPAVADVCDDPEGLSTYREVKLVWQKLAPSLRARVHLATLPMFDVEENAVLVNALQRRAQVVVQKSLAEGFGLTVAEAMWKARPMVASRTGGIQDQIVDGVSGTLVDPIDLRAFGSAVARYIDDPKLARTVGDAARERVRELFLGTRHLIQYLDLLSGLLAA